MVKRKGVWRQRHGVTDSSGAGERREVTLGFSQPCAEDVMFVTNVQPHNYGQLDAPIHAQSKLKYK